LSVVTPILSHPKLTAAQCDRLMKVFNEHESRAIDGYSEALKARYLALRATLHDASANNTDALALFAQTPEQKAQLQVVKAESAPRDALPRKPTR